jgi:hypothetical protein
MTPEEFQHMNRAHTAADWDVSAKHFNALFYGHGSQFRKVLEQLYEHDARAAGSFQRLGEIQVATGSHKPWLIDQHLSMAAFHAAHETSCHLNRPVDSLDSFYLKEKLTTISRFYDLLNSRLESAVWGLAEMGFPEFADRWNAWKSDYCTGIMSAHSLTSAMKGNARLRQRMHLCLDTLKDNLPELREFFSDARDVTGGYAGWWSESTVVEFLESED